MSYALFLVIFLCLPILGLMLCVWSQRREGLTYMRGCLLLIALAVSYTTPWDNYLVYKSVWWYGADRVLGTIGFVPIEEYLFFILQTILCCLWIFWLGRRESLRLQPLANLDFSLARRSGADLIGTFFWLILTLVGGAFLFDDSTFYLGLILAWASPVLALQWFYGGKLLLRHWRIYLLGFLVPTIYLCMADTFAISNGIWSISERYTTGIALGPLPIEEALFFLVTSLLVSQGEILFVLASDLLVKFQKNIRRALSNS